MIEIKKWSEMTLVEQEQGRKEQTAQLEAEKVKLAKLMSLDKENQSGIIRIQVTKDGKTSYADIYVDIYLKLLEIHKGMGDTMIQSVLNELNELNKDK